MSFTVKIFCVALLLFLPVFGENNTNDKLVSSVETILVENADIRRAAATVIELNPDYFGGGMQDNKIPDFLQSEDETTSSTEASTITVSIPTSTIVYPDPFASWYQMSTTRLIMLLLISFSIPVLFMGLLFWRLRKERKYLNSQNGALVYRETIIVPSYGVSNSSEGGDSINVAQMHSTLYDSPPDYDVVVKKPLEASKREPGVLEAQLTNANADEILPPAYSTIHL